jgi:hypothetical protein
MLVVKVSMSIVMIVTLVQMMNAILTADVSTLKLNVTITMLALLTDVIPPLVVSPLLSAVMMEISVL